VISVRSFRALPKNDINRLRLLSEKLPTAFRWFFQASLTIISPN
jgi:hypothetical protein